MEQRRRQFLPWIGAGVIVNDIEIMFGGQAGDGSLTTGDLIAGVFKRMGLEVYTYKDFPSRIRGGHTNYVIRAGEHPNYGMADFVDGLVAFDLEAVEAHIDEMRPGGFVIFDNTSEQIPDRRAPERRATGTRSRSQKSRKRNSVSNSCATRFRSACSAKLDRHGSRGHAQRRRRRSTSAKARKSSISTFARSKPARSTSKTTSPSGPAAMRCAKATTATA